MKRKVFVISMVTVTTAAALLLSMTMLHRSSGTVPSAKPDANGVRSESVAWVKQAVAKGALVLDVRKDDEWAAGRLANAVHIPLAQVQDRAGELPKGRLVVTVCKDGGRSYKAAYALRQAGYDAVNLAGGLTAWAAAGLPVVTDSGAPGRIM
jgi:rhodanese-related sulfurtransferase